MVFGMWESWDMLILLVELDKMSGFCHVCDVLVFFFFFYCRIGDDSVFLVVSLLRL